MVKKFATWATAAAVVTTLTAPATSAFAAAPAPTLHNDNATAKAGDWYTGAIPPNVNYNKPVILFVQGLHSDYTTWYNSDGYYDSAYNNGFRTAFVQLQDADGPGGDMWTNGPILANVIKKVANYYGVSKINIVAHSKGGIDTQTALVHYGAYPYVNVVHQLSTPNLGSELADLSYGSWTWWIGAIMGQQDDAVYSLQTSYMADFRSITDGLAANKYTRTYMADGTGDDGWFSATWYAHSVLPGHDDGAVATYSALGLPGGVFSFTDNGSETLSHGNMHAASKTWWEVMPKLTTTNYYTAAIAPATTSNTLLAAVNQQPTVTEESNNIMRGGAVNGTAQDSFTLESGLSNASIDVMTSSKATQVTLISPSGNVYTPSAVTQPTGDNAVLFAKAYHNSFSLPTPEKGTWQVKLQGSQDAYFLLANLSGGAKANLKALQKVHKSTDPYVQFSVNFDGGKADKSKIKAAKLTKASATGHSAILSSDVNLTPDSQGGLTSTIATPSTPGVYNVSFDVTGVNDKGETFTRSVNYNFAVTDANGKLK